MLPGGPTGANPRYPDNSQAATVIRRGAVGGAPRPDRLPASDALLESRFSLARLQRYMAA